MTEARALEVLNVIGDKIPQERYVTVKRQLLEVDDAMADAIMSLKLHTPLTIILFSVFLGGIGVDRFAIGDIGLGIGKLLVGWLTFGIWPLIDIFFCYKKAKEKNFMNIIKTLSTLPGVAVRA